MRRAAEEPPAGRPGGSESQRLCGALRRVWREPRSRRFTYFVFISMLAYSAQELLFEPFAGLVFGYSLGQSAQTIRTLARIGARGHGDRRRRLPRPPPRCAAACVHGVRLCRIGGRDHEPAVCRADRPAWPLRGSVIALGVANGVFAVAAIGSMMALAGQGEPGSAGVRMGLWGAAQALGFALGVYSRRRS